MLIARLLVTVTALGFGLLPFVTDLSASHAFNEDWPPHARFHLVWLVGTLAALALVIVLLAWRGPLGEASSALRLAVILGWVALAPFGLAALVLPVYGGALTAGPDMPEFFGVESNVAGFVAGAAMLSLATLLIARRG